MDISQYETVDEPTFRQTLDALAEAYHNDAPLVDDATFDALRDIYERRFGPYTAVGATVRGEKVTLPYYLSSMRKIKDENELERWTRSYPPPYIFQDKADGLTLLFTTNVINGRPTYRMYTRGDGSVGMDVSHLVNYMSIPKPEFNVSIRGEVIMYEDDHKRLFPNNANARGTVSGIINRKQSFDPSVGPYLHFLAFRIMESNETPETQILQLRQLGFETPWAGVSQDATIAGLDNIFRERKATAPYDVDGIVIYQNQPIDYPVGEDPRQVVAYKGLTETRETTVVEVIWEGSKNRLLNPVVVYNPIVISGATLQRANGYNARFIIDNKIGPGARIVVTRSGDTIPKIIAMVAPAVNPAMPDPNVHGAYTYTGVEFVLNQDNMQVMASKMENFIKKLDINGLGPGRIKAIIDSGITTIYDLLTATPEQFAQIPRFGFKLANQVTQELRTKTQNVELPVLMAASGVFPNFSTTRGRAIIETYPNILQMVDDPQLIQKLQQIRGIKQLANEFALRLPEFITWLNNHPMITYQQPGIPSIPVSIQPSIQPSVQPSIQPSVQPSVQPSIQPSIQPSVQSTLQGMTIVFSGFRDKALEAQVRQRGGRVTTSVSRNTSLLVLKDINDRKGKAQKAIQLGIPLISREEFVAQYI